MESFRLSPQQQHLWAHHRERANPFCAQAIIRIDGALDAAHLQSALNQVVQQHEILRTAFHVLPENGAAVQTIHAQRFPDFETHDLSDLPDAAQKTAIDDMLRAMQSLAFDLANDCLLRCALARLADQRYVLLLVAPALCADATGLQNLVRELGRACQPGEGDNDSIMQYADLAEWQHELLSGEEGKSGRDFWQKQNFAHIKQASLPFAQKNGDAAGFSPAVIEMDIPKAVVKKGCDSQATTPAVLLQACFATLLWRMSGEDEMVIGAQHSGRMYNELASQIGLFAANLPYIARFEAAMPFSAVIEQTQSQRDQAEKWQSFFSWQNADGGSSPESGPGFFRYSFDFIAQSTPFEAGDLTFLPQKIDAVIDRFTLRLAVREHADGATAAFHFDTARMQKMEVERFADSFLALLHSIAANPATPIGELDVLSENERQRLVIDFNDTATDYPTNRCIHHVIEEQAALRPDAIAIEFGEQFLSYGELNRRANRLAHYLLKKGARPETLVGVCIERSPEMLIAVLAVLKAGAAYLPLSPDYPQERIEFMLEDTQARIVLTTEAVASGQCLVFSDRLVESGRVGEQGSRGAGVRGWSPATNSQQPSANSQVVLLDRDWPEIAAESTQNPNVAMTPDNLIYVIYTSGSTGKPKGVLITHQGLMISNAARFAWFEQSVHKFLLLSSLSFDSSIVGIFWTLCTGGTLCLVPESAQKNMPELAATIAARNISHLLTLPSFYALLLEFGTAEQLRCLQTAIVAGEACPIKMVERHKSMLPQTALCSEYGATETTVFSSVYDCFQQTINFAPVGDPVDNIQMYVLNERLQPQPVWVGGEMHFGGDAISNGYLNRPDLTAERFVPDPFSSKPGQRLYKSGDLTRHLPNGDIEFLGRIDNQVKIRGFRIELEEIDAVLAAHPGVREVCVDAREAAGDGKRLVAYVAAEAGQRLKISELRNYLAEQVPDYMVPAHFVMLDSLPKNPNGKIDRHNLPEPGDDRPELETEFMAAQSYVEKKLAEIWAEVLRLEKVGVHDNFFALGGDSILSIQIISKANQAGLHLSPVHIFQHQTIAGLAQAVGEESMIHAEQGQITGSLPLTPIQHWFFEKNLPNPHHWNVSLLLEVRAEVPDEHFQQAAQALLAHHDALRIRYSYSPLEGGQGGVPDIAAGTSDARELPPKSPFKGELPDSPFERGIVQAIADPDSACPFDRVDVSDVHGEAQLRAIEQKTAEFQAQLSLEHGPLMRLVLFERGDGQQPYLLLVLHHLVCDVVSWRVLIEDLQRALRQLAKGQAIALPAKTTSFKYWAEKLHALAQSEAVMGELEYWQNALSGANAELPFDFDAGLSANTEASTRTVKVHLSEDETRRLLQEVPKAFNTQINDVLLTALVQAFQKWTGKSSLLVDLEGHGREAIFEEVDLSRTVAWFTSFYPAHFSLKTNPKNVIQEQSILPDAVSEQSGTDAIGGKIPEGMTTSGNGSLDNPDAAVARIKEQLRQIPNRGFYYGLLRYLCADVATKPALQNQPAPLVNFNYLGQFDQVLQESSLFALVQETNIYDRAGEGQRSHVLEIVGSVIGGQLQVEWAYSENLHKKETIAKLADDYLAALRAIIDSSQNGSASALTAADFAEFDWDADDLASISAAIGKTMGE